MDVLFRTIQKKLEERDITVKLTDAAKTLVAKAGFDPVYGARPLKRALAEIVEDQLAEMILEGQVKEGDTVIFDAQGDQIVTRVQ